MQWFLTSSYGSCLLNVNPLGGGQKRTLAPLWINIGATGSWKIWLNKVSGSDIIYWHRVFQNFILSSVLSVRPCLPNLFRICAINIRYSFAAVLVERVMNFSYIKIFDYVVALSYIPTIKALYATFHFPILEAQAEKHESHLLNASYQKHQPINERISNVVLKNEIQFSDTTIMKSGACTISNTKQ